MKKLAYPLLVFVILFILGAYSINAAEYDTKSELHVIKTYEEDVTGNGLKEVIELKGILFSPDSNYYRDIVAVITSSENHVWEIPYMGGYNPTLKFIDLNHDKVNNIFFQSSTGGSGGLYQYHLHTLIQNKLTELPLPEQPFVKGGFLDSFKVEITISPNTKPTIVNVQDRKEEYIRLGIYSEEGKVIKKTSTMVDPIAFFEPKFISKSKGYGLKSYQQVSGANHADQLGTVESLWYYDRDKWILLQTKWMPSN
ncbi:hypothetical protein H8S33_15335 [Ornithinibacillus sp. BX22]|uniref:VCBS repeat-containing protein n=1 Tax=Ornithinibacillus hominis TaxID=2763055 RepID=A0A923RKE9_9BACI|nr:hypothetical protein [Ornithinibacillus hominis]MBC5638168.1 hypothetical protein [Ornithinibacillus hominis]